MAVIELPRLCDRAAALALKGDLADTTGSEALQVDAGKVERMSMAMLQVLLASHRNDPGIVLIERSSEFDRALAVSGLTETFNTGVAA